MVVEAGRRPVEAFAQAAVEVASAVDLKAALAMLADATAAALEADLVLIRVVDPSGELVARAFAPEDSSLAAAVAASRAAPDDFRDGGVPEVTRRAAEGARAAGVCAVSNGTPALHARLTTAMVAFVLNLFMAHLHTMDDPG